MQEIETGIKEANARNLSNGFHGEAATREMRTAYVHIVNLLGQWQVDVLRRLIHVLRHEKKVNFTFYELQRSPIHIVCVARGRLELGERPCHTHS